MPPRRHVLVLGSVDSATVDLAVRLWKADEVNGALAAGDVLVVLYDPDRVGPPDFIDTLIAAAERGVPLGVVPIYPADAARLNLARLLDSDRLSIDFSRCRFRLGGTAAANTPDAPAILSRALHDAAAFVADDLDHADLLFLQGHSGPVDGSFGRWLTLCSRALHQSGDPVFFPCAGTTACFRQPSNGRPESASDGLIDPTQLRSALVLADGCGTFPVPGSLYRYGQSILRGLTLSSVRASVLSLGVSATPLSVVALFMAWLASGRTLGQSVLAANRHRRDCGSPSSIEHAIAAPWILVGNPAAVVDGIPLATVAPARGPGGILQFDLDPGDRSADTGTLVVLDDAADPGQGFDVACVPPAWAHGALHDGRACLWLAADAGARVTLRPRDPSVTAAWRESLFWLRAGSPWLQGLADAVAKRERDNASLLELCAVRDALAVHVEQAAGAATPHRRQEIASGIDEAAGAICAALSRLDRATAMHVAAAIPFAGARLSHLWSPAWLHGGYADVQETCACGCAIVGHVRRHPLNDLVRIELSCPTCSLIGDTAAAPVSSTPASGRVRPMVRASLSERVAQSGPVRWSVERLSPEGFDGFACATLFDPFRVRRAVSDVVEVPPGSRTTVALDLPADWPAGLAWTTLTFTAGARLCVFGFDVDVRHQPARALDEHPNRRTAEAPLRTARGADSRRRS